MGGGGGQYLGWEVSALPGASWARGGGAGAAVPAGGVTPSPRGMVTSWASDASSPQWGQKTMPFIWDTQALWKRWATRKSGWHSRKVPWGRETVGEARGSPRGALPARPTPTHHCTEVAAARTAVVLDHAGPVRLAEHHQGHAARGPHGLPLEDGGVAARQLWQGGWARRGEAGPGPARGAPLPAAHLSASAYLSVHALRGHALVPRSFADAVDLGRLHAAAAQGQLLQPALRLQGRSIIGHPLDRGERELRGALPLTHRDPWRGRSPPTLPAFPSMLQNPQSLAMNTLAPVGSPSSPFPPVLTVPPSGSLSQQLAINYQRGWGRGSPRWAAPGTPEGPPCTHWGLRSPHHSLLTQRQRE